MTANSPVDVPLLIAGEWQDGATHVDVLDKYTLTPYARAAVASDEQVRNAVSAAHAAYRSKDFGPWERGEVLDRAAALIARDGDKLVETVRAEAGFTLADAQGELRRCIQTFRLSAEEARRLAGEVVPIGGAMAGQGRRIGFTITVPLGVICAITPFNAPLNTVAHKIAPAIAAGNSVVLKPSSSTPRSATMLAGILLEAGLPPQRISVVHGGSAVARALIEQPQIKFFAFTGSTEVGRDIQQRVGLRRTQMELGSIAFTILCEDADLDVALPKVVGAAYRKAGQVCTSIQTLLVARPIMASVERRIADMVSALKYGDPHNPSTEVGPVISVASATRIAGWIDEAVSSGARLLVGGPREGAVVPPTLLADVDDRSAVSCQEIFGPVMTLVPFDTIEEAIERVNATPYGLATGVFTKRLDVAFKAIRELDVGGVHINETSSSRVDVMPYGGTKDSGFGREGPHYAVHEMSEQRMVTLSV